MPAMKTIDEIRRENLVVAIERAGSAAKLAAKAELSSAYLSQLKTRQAQSSTGKLRTMGDAVARKIEAAINAPLGWMDRDHSGRPSLALVEPTAAPQINFDAVQLAKLIELFVHSTDHGRVQIMDAAESAEKLPVFLATSAARD